MGMGANELITLLGGAGSILGELKVLVDKTYGSIRGRTPAVIDGKKGYLIWDHMIWNEITFETDEGKILWSIPVLSARRTAFCCIGI